MAGKMLVEQLFEPHRGKHRRVLKPARTFRVGKSSLWKHRLLLITKSYLQLAWILHDLQRMVSEITHQKTATQPFGILVIYDRRMTSNLVAFKKDFHLHEILHTDIYG
jgi:hypothetical protein